MGCGHLGAKARQENRNIPKPYNFTCPVWLLNQPQVQRVYIDLGDYRRGALGHAWDIPCAHLQLLRILDGEMADWQHRQDAKLMEEARKEGASGNK